MKERYVFISYTTINQEVAEKVRDILTRRGIKCWMAPESIPSGSTYPTEIYDAVSDCSAFVLILTKESMESVYVSKETDLAVSNRRFIIPFQLDKQAPVGDFRFYLCNIQIMPVDGSVEQAALMLADRICSFTEKDQFRQIRPAQRFEKPPVSIIRNEEALDRLNQLFSDNNLVCISGMGGMGKSELAKTYISALIESDPACIVSYNSCPESIHQAVSMIPFDGLTDDEILEAASPDSSNVEDLLYQKKYALLQQTDQHTVLVFDGLSFLDYDGMSALDKLKCKVLVTTRCFFEEYPELRMEEFMTFERQKELFLKYYEDFSGDEADMEAIEKIILSAGGHTLTLKLIALYLNTTGMPPEELYQQMFAGEKVALDLEEKVANGHEYQTIRTHIDKLFRMTALTSKEIVALQELSYIPADGISKRIFRTLTPDGTMPVVDLLVKKGWIRNHKGIISLHPVIQSVMRDKRPASLDELSFFFDALINYLNNKETNSVSQKSGEALLCRYLFNELNETSLLAARLYLSAGSCMNDYTYWLLYGARNAYRFTNFTQMRNQSGAYLDQFSEAVNCLKKALAVCDSLGIDNEDGVRARIYSNLGCAYYNMRRFEDAVTCHTKALELRTAELGSAHEKTVTSRRRLGTSNLELGNYDAALQCYQTNRSELGKSGAPLWLLSKASYDCGKVYLYKGEYDNALPFLLQAVDEIEKEESFEIDPYGIAQLFYMTGMTMIVLDHEHHSDEYRVRADTLLKNAREYAASLDAEAAELLIRLIDEQRLILF